jgi:hypothetical protein
LEPRIFEIQNEGLPTLHDKHLLRSAAAIVAPPSAKLAA